MILSFFTKKSTRSAKLSSVFAERFSGEGQADFAINKAHKVSLKDRNNLYISCVFNGFKYMFLKSHHSPRRIKTQIWSSEVCIRLAPVVIFFIFIFYFFFLPT